MTDTLKTKQVKLTSKERFRQTCPEVYEQILAEKVKVLPPDKQALFFRLAAKHREAHLYI